MAAYYNEIDSCAAHVLDCLIRDGVIADGDIDTRSIVDVGPEDLAGYTQCHFFAGGGLWSVAARFAGWPDGRPLWTGSCPCQPFSVAGKGAGTDDPRHLWPHFFRLISACKPKVVMGEQVAGKAGYGWLDGVRSDLEAEGYACDGVDIPACAVNAPHIRQRLYWVAHTSDIGTGRVVGQASDGGRQAMDAGAKSLRRADGARSAGGADARDTVDVANADVRQSKQSSGDGARPSETLGRRSHTEPSGRGELVSGDMADAESIGRGRRSHDEDEGRRQQSSADTRKGGGDVADADSGISRQRGFELRRQKAPGEFGICGEDDMADADDSGRQGWPVYAQCPDEQSAWSRGVEWRRGADGKTRRVKSDLCLLVDGMPGRVGLLRIGGNAIVAPLAAEVIKAFMEVM